MKQFIYGCRCTVTLQTTPDSASSILMFCHHFALFSPPIDVVRFLDELRTIDAKLRLKDYERGLDVLNALSSVRLASPVQGAVRRSIEASRFKAAFRSGLFTPALLAGYWPELHALKAVGGRKPVGCAWLVRACPNNWQAGLTINGPDRQPVLELPCEPLEKIRERLEASETIDALAQWASAL